jgi:hypothetical protein
MALRFSNYQNHIYRSSLFSFLLIVNKKLNKELRIFTC